ncbi:hypothetical protein KCP73_05875 [Salmonella enterica subsp. enterica]|nr:hypothetical protein KCP73_05875 [Salmonella enterica subsp. enterica]
MPTSTIGRNLFAPQLLSDTRQRDALPPLTLDLHATGAGSREHCIPRQRPADAIVSPRASGAILPETKQAEVVQAAIARHAHR